MIHISDLGKYAHRFFADKEGHVPEPGDHWRNMKIDHGDHDPDEPGISEEERKRRIAYLDEHWWPQVIAQVTKEKETLSQLPDGNPIHKWREEVMKEPPAPHGFRVELP